jgi:hypothetical protein
MAVKIKMVSEEKIKVYDVRRTDGRTSDGKTSHGLWSGELKKKAKNFFFSHFHF